MRVLDLELFNLSGILDGMSKNNIHCPVWAWPQAVNSTPDLKFMFNSYSSDTSRYSLNKGLSHEQTWDCLQVLPN